MKGRNQPLLLTLLSGALLLPVSFAKPITNWTREDLLAAKAEWRRQGFKLDLTEFQIAGSSPAQIEAAAAVTNFGHVVSQPIGGDGLTPMKVISETHSLVVSSQTILPSYRGKDLWPLLREDLAEENEMLERARKAVLVTPLRFDLKPRAGGDILLPHLASLKKCATLLSTSALLNLRDGKRAEAWNDFIALVTTTVRWEVEPIEISHLVRGALVKITYSTLWEMLSTPGWSEDQLSNVQQLLESLDLLTRLPDIYAFQRATTSASFAAAREPDSTFIDDLKFAAQNPRQAISMMDNSMQQRKNRKQWAEKQSYAEEGLLLDDYILKEVALKKALRQKTWQQMLPIWMPASTNEIKRVNMPFAGPLLDRIMIQRTMLTAAAHAQGFGTGGALGRVIDAEAHRRLMITAIAIERYRLENSTIPTSLEALTPKFLKSIPQDPIDGAPLRYLPESDGEFLLYSIALDEKDNGGKQNMLERGYPPKPRALFDWLWPKRTTTPPPSPQKLTPGHDEDDSKE